MSEVIKRKILELLKLKDFLSVRDENRTHTA